MLEGALIQVGPKDAERTVFFLHGLTGTAKSVKSVAEYLLKKLPPGSFRFLLPTAPMMFVQQLGHEPVHAWFNIRSTELESGTDAAGVLDASATLDAFLTEEIEKGIHPNELFIGGFSQGGVVSLITALSYPYALGGVFALSSFLPSSERIRERFTLASKETPVFFAAGSNDEIISRALQQKTCSAILEHGCRLEFHEYDFRHEIKSGELDDLALWLKRSAGLQQPTD